MVNFRNGFLLVEFLKLVYVGNKNVLPSILLVSFTGDIYKTDERKIL